MFQDPETLFVVIRQRQSELRDQSRQTPANNGRERLIRFVRKPQPSPSLGGEG